MSDHLTIETPEQIPLDFQLAGIGSRFLALALDSLIQAGALVVLVIIAGLVSSQLGKTGRTWLWAIVVLGWFLIRFTYFALFEALWNGQTPGKRWVHLRVIKESGRAITAYESIARNLLRLVDSIPEIYAVGIVSALLSSRSKRLGDYVAGTVVVREQPLRTKLQVGWTLIPPPASDSAKAAANPGLELGLDVSRLSPEEFQLVDSFLERRRQLAAEVRGEMARRISHRIASKLDLPAGSRPDSEKLLEAVAAAYRNRAAYGSGWSATTGRE